MMVKLRFKGYSKYLTYNIANKSDKMNEFSNNNYHILYILLIWT